MNRSIKKSIWTKALLGGGLIFLFVLALIGHAAAQTCVKPPAGLISWWPADGDANDIQGVNNGTLLDGATFAAGMVGQAFSFDGTSRVSAPTTGLPIGNSDRTLELWVKVNNYVAKEAFLAGYGRFGSYDQTYVLGTTGGGVLFFSQWGQGISGPALLTGRWYHVAVTNVGNLVTLYLDGAAVASGSFSIKTPSGTNLFIGSLPGDPDRRLDGLIDEVRIYDRALSTTEIQSIFLAGSQKCLRITPIDVDFGGVLKDTNSDQTINVKNIGIAPLTISAIESPEAPFSIVGGTCTAPKVLSPAESCTIVVRFSPTAYGPVSSSFVITSDDPEEASWTVHLSGRTRPPVCVVMIDLGTLGGSESDAYDINASGQVVGTSYTAGDAALHAFSWTQAGGMIDLGTMGGNNSHGVGVDGSDQVIGFSDTADGTTHAFSWTQAGGMVDLGTLGGNNSIPNAINASGQVVGFTNTADGAQHAFLWTEGGGMVDLGPGAALAVNASGQVVGQNGASHAFSWTERGGMVDLGTLSGGDWSAALAVNDSGQAVGISDTCSYYCCETCCDDWKHCWCCRSCGGCGTPRAFSWTEAGGMVDLGGSHAIAVNASGQVVGQNGDHAFSWTQSGGMVDLGTLGGARSDVGSPTQQFHSAVNAGGQVVGGSQTTDGSTDAFSWTQAGGMIDLRTLLGGEQSGALVVNDRSEIIGHSEIANGKHHAVLWIPLIVTDVSFGPVAKGSSSDKAVDVKNAGTAPLTFSSIGSPGAPFSIAGGTCTASTVLQGGQSCTVSVRFSPTDYGPASSSFLITIAHPEEVSVTIHLSGKGGVPHVVVTPTEIDFGAVARVKPSDRYVTVRNDESASCSLTISGIESPAAPFSIVAGDCSAGKDLSKGESCTIQVRFSPTDIGVVTSSFNITSDDTEKGSVQVSLSGKGSRIVVEPNEGTIGSEVTMTGWSGGFGGKKGKALIGGVAPKITQWTDNEIKGTLTKVPALDASSDVVVQPKVKGAAAITESGAFTARGPKIASVNPGSGVSGSTSPITIHGEYFSTKKGKVTLERGGVVKSCKVASWTMDPPSGESTIQFLVPKKLTPAADYTLRVSNSVGSDTTTFTVTAP